MEIEEIG